MGEVIQHPAQFRLATKALVCEDPADILTASEVLITSAIPLNRRKGFDAAFEILCKIECDQTARRAASILLSSHDSFHRNAARYALNA